MISPRAEILLGYDRRNIGEMNIAKKPKATAAVGNYSRHRGKSDDEIVHSECLRALRNIESYNFKHGHQLPKKRGSPNRLVTSSEMEESSVVKMEYYRVQTEKWADRNSIIAAPMGAELFLKSDRASTAKVMGAPRFYFGDPVPPVNEAFDWSRFPYSHEGNDAAKMITRMFHRHLNKKYAAAIKIQTIYRKYKCRNMYLAYRVEMGIAGAVITRFCRRKYARFVFVKEKANRENQKAARIQSHIRRALVRMNLPKFRQERLDRCSRTIATWFKARVHAIRKKRGVARRLRVHATRIQAPWRGALLRMMLFRWRSCQVFIAFVWRRFFKRSFQPHIVRIYRTIRRYTLHAKIRRIQRHIRGFIGRRRAHRQRLDIIAKESRRSAAEQRMIGDAVRDLTRSRHRGIMFDMTIDTDSVAAMMQEINEICSKILIGLIVPAEPLADAVHAHEEAVARIAENAEMKKQQQHKQQKPQQLPAIIFFGGGAAGAVPHLHPVLRIQDRVLLALLVAFVNRPNFCIDHTAWRICKQYLTYVGEGGGGGGLGRGNGNFVSGFAGSLINLTSTLSVMGLGNNNNNNISANNINNNNSAAESNSNIPPPPVSGFSAFSATYTGGAATSTFIGGVCTATATTAAFLSMDESLLDIPADKPMMINIFDIFFSRRFAAKRLLQFRASVRGRLPDIIIAQAAMARLWTRTVQQCLVETITAHRETVKPKYCCSDCMQPMWSPVALSRHLPCQRNSYFGWVHRQCFIHGEDLLAYTCNHIHQPPVVLQPRKKIDVKLDNDSTEVLRLEDVDVNFPGIMVQKTVYEDTTSSPAIAETLLPVLESSGDDASRKKKKKSSSSKSAEQSLSSSSKKSSKKGKKKKGRGEDSGGDDDPKDKKDEGTKGDESGGEKLLASASEAGRDDGQH